ncbi:hypothetical protein JDFnp1_75 [Fusobacterium phage JD-Fnp1]|nr:hypothetical protein JDFnp1_75 [Fusobacterium phage JD-Fnp1]
MKSHKLTKRDLISLFLVLGIFASIGIAILKINMSIMRPKPPVVKTVDEYVNELTIYYINRYHKDVKVLEVSMRDISNIRLYKETKAKGIYTENEYRFTVLFEIQDDYKSLIEVIVYQGDRFIEIRK